MIEDSSVTPPYMIHLFQTDNRWLGTQGRGADSGSGSSVHTLAKSSFNKSPAELADLEPLAPYLSTVTSRVYPIIYCFTGSVCLPSVCLHRYPTRQAEPSFPFLFWFLLVISYDPPPPPASWVYNSLSHCVF